jgi:hypothetical protein
MGADIHLWVERRTEKSWQFANSYEIEQFDKESWIAWDEPFSDRNYFLFALLAGVRNLDTKFMPILPVRGMPTDISEIGKRIVDEWEGDGHSHSWASAIELLNHSWSDEVPLRGYVKTSDAIAWRNERRAPTAWAREWNSEFDELLAWEDTKENLCGYFVSEFLPKLLSYGPLEDTRVLFFFDN